MLVHGHRRYSHIINSVGNAALCRQKGTDDSPLKTSLNSPGGAWMTKLAAMRTCKQRGQIQTGYHSSSVKPRHDVVNRSTFHCQ